MIALKTSPLLFGHEILLVFHLFLFFSINSMTYDLYRQFNFQKVLHIIFYLCYCIAFVNCQWKKNLNLVGFLSCQALYFVILYLVIWKGLIIVTVILVIADIEGMCIFLLHWFEFVCSVDRINFKCSKVFR